ncbi:MAG: galactokinase [Candidatus Sumerlaeaceae bacterium]
MINLSELQDEFRIRFSASPTHHVISPGRVNLIGEHTDYNMLPVLPMAINHGLNFLVRPSGSARVRIQNSSSRYHPAEFEGAADIPKGTMGDSTNYVKAAVQYAWPVLQQRLGREPEGYDALIASDLPPAAGLSSSSATVVGAYLSLCAVNGVRLERADEPEAMRLAERYVGTASGGMDQATILLGREHKALLIDFDPVRTTEVSIPDGIVFFAVDSLQRAAKSGNARFHYNRRTFECQCAVELMKRHILADEKSCGPKLKDAAAARDWQFLRDVLNAFEGDSGLAVACARDAIHQEPWSLDELRAVLGSDCDELLRAKMLPPANDDYWNGFSGFKPYQRAAHVLAEAGRVQRCAAALSGGNVAAAAAAMTESHQSCRDLYEISTPQIEELTAAALKCGALAARITGAGFGGSIVAMVKASETGQFSEWLWKEHFSRLPEQTLAGVQPDTCILECRPGDGARIRQL